MLRRSIPNWITKLPLTVSLARSSSRSPFNSPRLAGEKETENTSARMQRTFSWRLASRRCYSMERFPLPSAQGKHSENNIATHKKVSSYVLAVAVALLLVLVLSLLVLLSQKRRWKLEIKSCVLYRGPTALRWRKQIAVTSVLTKRPSPGLGGCFIRN